MNGVGRSADGRTRAGVDGALLLRAITAFRDRPVLDPAGLADLLDTQAGVAEAVLGQLAAHGFAEPVGGASFRPGAALREVASALHSATGLLDVAGPVLAALASETGETAQLAVPDGGRTARIVAAHECTRVLRVGGDVGQVVREPASLAAVLGGRGATASTFDPAAATGICTVAVAVPDTAVALGLAAPVSRMDPARHDAHLRLLTTAATRLAAALAAGDPGQRP